MFVCIGSRQRGFTRAMTDSVDYEEIARHALEKIQSTSNVTAPVRDINIISVPDTFDQYTHKCVKRIEFCSAFRHYSVMSPSSRRWLLKHLKGDNSWVVAIEKTQSRWSIHDGGTYVNFVNTNAEK